MSTNRRRALRLLLTFVVMLVAGCGGQHSDKETHKLDGPKATVPGNPTITKVTLDDKGQKIVEQQEKEDAAGNDAAAESDLHEHALPAPEDLRKAKDLQPPGQPEIPARVPLAAASQPGCTTAFVQNYSSRRGAPVDLGFIHWTGSAITAGPQAGLAIVHWFDLPAAQASSNYITDQAGRCWYTVPETQKAWTQAAANPWSVSVEIINPGVLPLFRSTAARNVVVKLIIGWHHRWKIPYRLGAVNSNCTPIRSGFLAHRDGGPCAGGHPDVGIPSAVPALIAEAKRQDAPVKPLTAAQQKACDKLNFHRRRAHIVGRWYRTRLIRTDQLKLLIPKGRCPSKYRHQ